jgi:hypothetical protein
MATGIDQRAEQLGEKLGEPLGERRELAPGVILAPFYNAILIEIDGEAWVLSEATQASLFDQPQP